MSPSSRTSSKNCSPFCSTEYPASSSVAPRVHVFVARNFSVPSRALPFVVPPFIGYSGEKSSSWIAFFASLFVPVSLWACYYYYHFFLTRSAVWKLWRIVSAPLLSISVCFNHAAAPPICTIMTVNIFIPRGECILDGPPFLLFFFLFFFYVLIKCERTEQKRRIRLYFKARVSEFIHSWSGERLPVCRLGVCIGMFVLPRL